MSSGPDRSSLSRGSRLALALILFIGLALRLAGLDAKPLWEDEAWTFHTATAPEGALAISGMDPHPLSFYLLYRSLPEFFLVSDWAFRLPSAAFSFLALLLFVRMMRLASSDEFTIVMATAFFAFLPINIRYAFEARAYALAELLAVAVLTTCLAAARRPDRPRLGALVLAAALSAHMDGFGLAAPFAVFIYGLLNLRRNRSARSIVVAAMLGVILAVPYYAFRIHYFSTHAEVHAIGVSANLATGLLSRVVELTPFGVGADQLPSAYRIWIYALAIICIGVMLMAARPGTVRWQPVAARTLFAAMAVATPIVYMIMSGALHANLIHKKYLIVTACAIAPLFVGGLLAWGPRLGRAAAAAVALTALAVSVQLLISPGDRADWRALYNDMKSQIRPGDLLLQEREENYPDYSFGPLRAYALRDGAAIPSTSLIEYDAPSKLKRVSFSLADGANWDSREEGLRLGERLNALPSGSRVWTISTDWIAEGRTLDLSSWGSPIATCTSRGVSATLWLRGGGGL